MILQNSNKVKEGGEMKKEVYAASQSGSQTKASS
jgi:hypothetical protein